MKQAPVPGLTARHPTIHVLLRRLEALSCRLPPPCDTPTMAAHTPAALRLQRLAGPHPLPSPHHKMLHLSQEAAGEAEVQCRGPGESRA